MKKVIRLTESDLVRLVKRVINEQNLNEPVRYSFGDVNKLKQNLLGRTIKMIGSSVKHTPILKIEAIEVEGDLVKFDCGILDEYGQSKGGAFDAGVFGNVDLTYNCTSPKMFKIEREYGNTRNVSLGNEIYVNPKLAEEIQNLYCKSKKPVKTIPIDY
jgi:hypothetical protein